MPTARHVEKHTTDSSLNVVWDVWVYPGGDNTSGHATGVDVQGGTEAVWPVIGTA